VLNHPNVCTVYSVEECAGQPAIVMELLEGETLEQRLKAGPLSVGHALALAIPIAAAMEAAHRKGIVHRDLKPANVVVSETGVKVVDFGLAKTVSGAPGVTEHGAILGTPSYMAPEQMLGQETGVWSDIYSFGIMLREMLGGNPPSSLERVVARCLARAPENRWHSAGDLKAALEMIAAGQTSPDPPRWRLPLPSWWPRALAAAACIAIAAAVLVWQPFRRVPARLTIATPGPAISGRMSVAPDGERVAYHSNGRIWVRVLGEEISRPVAGSEGAGSPFWSPDGKYIAFSGGGRLYKVPVSGGMPQALSEMRTNVAGSWGANGQILIGEVGDGIYRVPTDGGERVRVTAVDPEKGEARHMLPQWLPGEQKFLYAAGSARAGASVLWASSADGTWRKELMKVDSGVALVKPLHGTKGYLVYLSNRSLVGEPFDVETLRRGEPRILAPVVAASSAIGTALHIGDFSAAGRSLAYRASVSPQGMIQKIANGEPAVQTDIVVLRDWM
jgi:serine/threonine-protein kinase